MVVDDLRRDAGKRPHGGPGLADGDARQRGDHRRAGLGLPPGVHDRSLVAAEHQPVPAPGFRVDRFAHRSQQPQAGQIVLEGKIAAPLHEGPNQRGRGVIDCDAVLFDDLEMPVLVRGGRRSLVHHLGGAIGQWAVDDIAVTGDPADIGCTPIDVGLRLDVEDIVVRVGGLRQVSTGGVHDAFGLAGGAGGVEQEKRVLGIEGLGGVLGGGRIDRLVPPQVATVGPIYVDSGAAHHQNVLHRGLPGDRLVHGGLQRHRTPTPVLPIGGDHQLGLRVLHAGPQCRGGESAEHHRVHDAQPRARQHRHDRLGHHRHVDGHPVTGDQAQIGQGVGCLADLVLELGVGDGALIAERLALPVDGDTVAVAGLDMAVHTVVGDVELAAHEPLRDRSTRPVEHLAEGRGPRQPIGLFRPEPHPVGIGPLVEFSGGVRGAREGHRRRIQARNVVVRLGHGCERSHHVCPLRWYVTCGQRSRHRSSGRRY